MKALSAAFCENFKAFGFLLKTPGKDTMKHFTMTMLTMNTLTRAEAFCDPEKLSDAVREDIEHLAYCANMGAESNDAAWDRFRELMEKYHPEVFRPAGPSVTFFLYDVNDYFETVELDSEDYENEFTADISGCRDEDEETWNDERVRETTEAQVKAHFGPSAVVVWEFR